MPATPRFGSLRASAALRSPATTSSTRGRGCLGCFEEPCCDLRLLEPAPGADKAAATTECRVPRSPSAAAAPLISAALGGGPRFASRDGFMLRALLPPSSAAAPADDDERLLGRSGAESTAIGVDIGIFCKTVRRVCSLKIAARHSRGTD